MKMRLYVILAGLGILLMACGESSEVNGENTELTGTAEEQENAESAGAAEERENIESAGAAEEQKNIESTGTAERQENTDSAETVEQQEPQAVSNEGQEESQEETAAKPFYYLIENPSQEYYATVSSSVLEEDIFLSLEQLTEEANEITDTEKWFADNGFEFVSGYSMEDDVYQYMINGDDGYSGYLLDMYLKENGEYLQQLDFSAYRYTDGFKEEDRSFIEQRIWWAQSVDDILYVAIGHNTYTESCPHTGYLVAIDINDMSVIWKSAPCTTNARNFEIIDDTIICGYGFTSEPDYLKLVYRLDGSLMEEIPIKTMAEYIVCKDDIVYVRTYDTNYTFQVKRMIMCR